MLCFDPSSINEGGLGGLVVEDGFSQTQNPNFSPNFSMSDHQSFHQNSSSSHQPQHVEDGTLAALSMEYQQKLNLEMEQCYNCISNPNSNQISTHLMQEMPNQVLSCVESNWEDMNLCTHQQQQQQEDQQHIMQMEMQSMQSNPYPPTADLLNMLPFQRTSPSSLLSFEGPGSSGTHKSSSFLSSLGLLGDHHHHLPSDHHHHGGVTGVSFDPLLPVNLPPQQPPLLRELMQNYNSRNHGGSLFSGVVDERCDGFFQENIDQIGRGYNENGVFEFSTDMNCIGKGREVKGGKHYTTERQRRVQLNGKFEDLRKLVPNPSKNDRASVLKDAIDYINELKMRVSELKILVSKKRSNKERLKRQNTAGGDSSCNNNNSINGVVKTEDHMDGDGSALRSSWIHRKSKNTEIDVRIIDDEVTVKLVQQKKINCLMFVSKVLDELQLDLHHVAGGLIGDYYSFLLNSKICEGSTVHTQAIANRLIEVVDKHYAAVQPTGSF